MGHPKKAFLCSTCLELFLARSSLFKLAMACYWLFHFLQAMKSQKSTSTSASVIISGTAFLNYEQGQVVLHLKVGQFLLQSRATFTVRWNNN